MNFLKCALFFSFFLFLKIGTLGHVLNFDEVKKHILTTNTHTHAYVLIRLPVVAQRCQYTLPKTLNKKTKIQLKF